MSQTSLVARQCRLQEWASMIRECNARPIGMTVNEWCQNHAITKADYYYRLRQVRLACLDATAAHSVEQSVVPVPMELLEEDTAKTDSFLEIKIGVASIRITEQTSPVLLERVLKVMSHVE